jgi:DNA-binding GntR family transcriptional regulator
VSGPHCSLIAQHGLPTVVIQALDDTQLPMIARVTMWHLRERLDVVHYVEVKVASLAMSMRVKERTLNDALVRLAAEGYLDVHQKQRPRAYRFPWSRLQDVRRAA